METNQPIKNEGMDMSEDLLFSEPMLTASDSSSSDTSTTIAEILYDSLGKFYFEAHPHCPPTFLQVVGWTINATNESKKRVYVYVRKVPLLINNSPNGGYWHFDHDVIKKYQEEIQKPVHSCKSSIVSGNAILIPGGKFLRYSGITVPQISIKELLRSGAP